MPQPKLREVLNDTKDIPLTNTQSVNATLVKEYGDKLSSARAYTNLLNQVTQMNNLLTSSPPQTLRVPEPVVFLESLPDLPENVGTIPDADNIIVQIRIEELYADTQYNVELIKALNSVLPPKLTRVQKETPVSGFVADEYRLGDRPKSETVLETAVSDLNRIETGRYVEPGEYFSPALPPHIRKDDLRAPEAPFVRFSGLSESKSATTSLQNLAFRNTEIFYSPVLHGGRIVEYTLPANYARRLAQNLQLRQHATALNGSIPVKLAEPVATNTSGSFPLLTDQEKVAIKTVLTNAKRSCTLLIQDTGWPSSATQVKTYKTCFRICDSVWANHLGRPSPYSRNVPAFKEPVNKHVKDIEASLGDFRGLDASNRIEIIYLPLTTEQNAAELLTELVHLSLLIQQTSSGVPLSTFKGKVSEMGDIAKKITKSLRGKWEGNQVNTDVAVACAPLHVFSFFNESNSYTMFCQSWTTPHMLLKPNFPTPLSGVIVAAAGNEGTNYNVLDHLPDFVSRCQGYPDTLGVLNVHRGKELDRDSSDLRGVAAELAFVAGFDGYVNSTANGTSFSAPRVAWLLAAAETVRAQDCRPVEWSTLLKEQLKKSRKSALQPDKFWVNPIDLMSW